LPVWSFSVFILATFLSLIAGHAMGACHRKSLAIGEYAPPVDYSSDGMGSGGTRRLCDIVRRRRANAALGVHGLSLALVVSFMLALTGLFVETFEFRFLGLGGAVMGEAAARPLSIIDLSLALPYASLNPNGFAVRWIQVFFIGFVACTVLLYLLALLLLWLVPLTNQAHRQVLIVAQMLGCWSGLDVFMVAIAACSMEIRQYVKFMMGDACNSIDGLMQRLIPGTWIENKIPGPLTCFDVEAKIYAGFWVLGLAAFLATATGRYVQALCADALGSYGKFTEQNAVNSQ